MLRKTLGSILTRIGQKLAPKPDAPLSPTERWLKKVKADFKKKRLINPSTGRLDVRFNPLAIDDGPCCFPIRDPRAGDPSEELAFLEWMEERGIKLPKKDILKNDDKWHPLLDTNYNPLDNDEDFFIPQRDAA